MTNETVNNETENTSTETLGAGPGRPALIDEDLFCQVWQASDSLDEVVSVFFPETKNEQEKKTRRLYCSMRASTIRRSENGVDLKTFPRGRKPNKAPVVVNETPAESSDELLKVAE